jgi:hypothetical protein
MNKIIAGTFSLLMLAPTLVYAASKAKSYDLDVEVFTANKTNAGTDDKIYVTVHGALGSTTSTRLDTKDHNDFEKNKHRTYIMRGDDQRTKPIGDILGITVRLGGEAKDGWGINKIIITDKKDSDNTATFFQNENAWVDDKAEHGYMSRSLTRLNPKDRPVTWETCVNDEDMTVEQVTGYYETRTAQHYGVAGVTETTIETKQDVWTIGNEKMTGSEEDSSYTLSASASGSYEADAGVSNTSYEATVSAEVMNSISKSASNKDTSSQSTERTQLNETTRQNTEAGTFYHVTEVKMKNGMMLINNYPEMHIEINQRAVETASIMDKVSFDAMILKKCWFRIEVPVG